MRTGQPKIHRAVFLGSWRFGPSSRALCGEPVTTQPYLDRNGLVVATTDLSAEVTCLDCKRRVALVPTSQVAA